MFGTFRINLLFGLIGLCMSLLLSFSTRFPLQSCLKAGISFVIFYLFAYVVRVLLHISFKEKEQDEASAEVNPSNEEQQQVPERRTEKSESLSDEQVESVSTYVKELMKE